MLNTAYREFTIGLQEALQDKPVVRLIVTHMHPDHCGRAGWLTESFDARLWMTRLEYLTCRLKAADTKAPAEGINFFRAATEPDPNPLLDWLTSLERIKAVVHDSVLVLPSHNSPFFDLHARLDQLLGHHRLSLDLLISHLALPQRVVDVFTVLFKRPISAETMNMATGEAVAHLNYLLFSQQAARERDSAGVWRWRSSAGSGS